MFVLHILLLVLGCNRSLFLSVLKCVDPELVIVVSELRGGFGHESIMLQGSNSHVATVALLNECKEARILILA